MVDANIELSAGFTVKQWYADLLAEGVVRHSANEELKAGFEGMVRLDLPAAFAVQRTATGLNVGAEFDISTKGWVSQGLPVSVYRDLSIVS
jgi:hypothetical protein